MPKKDDQPDELPKKVDDWKAPWEVDKEGEDIPEEEQKLDGARLKKYLFGLLTDKQRLRTQVNELTTAKEELEQEVADAKDPKALEDLQKKLEKANADLEKAKNSAENDIEKWKLEIALDKGLTKRQAARLVGKTREELEDDADELVEELGLKKDGDDDGGGETESKVRSTPKRVANGRKRGEDGPPKEKDLDPDEWAKAYAARKGLGYA